MVERWTNRAVGELLTGISAGDLSMTLKAGQGALFPSLSPGQWFWAALEEGTLYAPTLYEIVRCTARSSDAITIERAQQGTIAAAFGADARVTNRITRSTLERLRDLILEREPNSRILGATSYSGCGSNSTSQVGHWYGGATAVPTTATLAATNQQTSMYRAIETVTTSTTAVFGFRGAAGDSVMRGNAPGIGGFRGEGKLGLPNNNNGTRLFVGLAAVPAAFLLTAGDPTAQTTVPMFGFGFDSTSTTVDNLRLFHHDGGGGAVSDVDTGITRAECVGELLYFLIRAEPNSSGIRVILKSLVTGTLFDSVITTNLPPPTTLLQWQFSIRGNGGSNSIQLHYAAGIAYQVGF